MIAMLMKTSPLLVLLVIATMLPSCSEVKKGERSMAATERVSAEEWNIISQKRILFGHQSVGNNILSGVKTLAGQDGVNFKVMESRNAASDFGITHFKIGMNEDPQSKIKDFEDTLKSGAALGADIALMKFCYIDFKGDTDAKKLAEDYRLSLDNLCRKFPQTIFIAVTAPLRTVQSGPKAVVKRILGRDPGGFEANLRRQEFNNILRNSYGQQGRLFDLAKYEAEGAESHKYKGQPLEVLNPAISDDGGHLNAVGEKIVATKFLKFVAATTHQ